MNPDDLLSRPPPPGLHSLWFRTRCVLLAAVTLGLLVACLLLPPIHQDLAYHSFADRRTLLGIPNFFDVFTNLPFLLIGAAGLRHGLRNPQAAAPLSWQFFFGGVTLVGLGSAWYHLGPSNASLVWDRLAMALAFMGLAIAVLAEHTARRTERLLLWPALLVGVASVAWWAHSDDLRLYLWVQITPLLVLPLAIALFRGTYTHRGWLWGGLAFYLGAKVAELLDGRVFQATGGVMSGHSLKHLCAALGILALYHMIRRREERGWTAGDGWRLDEPHHPPYSAPKNK